jgi:hypothetical protein
MRDPIAPIHFERCLAAIAHVWSRGPRRAIVGLVALSMATLLPACTSRTVMEFVVPECEASGDHPQSRAAACVTRAVYEIAEDKRETSKGNNPLDVDNSATR